jgi:hypothetical protein
MFPQDTGLFINVSRNLSDGFERQQKGRNRDIPDNNAKIGHGSAEKRKKKNLNRKLLHGPDRQKQIATFQTNNLSKKIVTVQL